jgi:L-fuculose-phosphate aldolase
LKSATDELFAGAWFRFPSGAADTARQRIRELLERRIATQPLQLPNAGSVFRTPPGDHAARLIEAAGATDPILGGSLYFGPVMDGLSLPPRFDGPHAPSSEWLIHLDLHNGRDDALAVLHVHSPYATTLACSERVQQEGIPAFHYMVGVAGGTTIRCAEYATFGTQALADSAVMALAGRRACLLANHGVVAIGANLRAAATLAREVENLASQYLDMLAARIEPVTLTPVEMDAVRDQFEGYGQRLRLDLAPPLLALSRPG